MKRKTVTLLELKNIKTGLEVKEVFKGFALVLDLYPVTVVKSPTYTTREALMKAVESAGITLEP